MQSWDPARATLIFAVFPLAALGAGPTAEELAKLPPPSQSTIDSQRDIQPIFEAACIKCHGRGRAKGGFKIDSRETFLQPADSGPAVVVGESAHSRLIHLVAGLDPDSVMPKKGS